MRRPLNGEISAWGDLWMGRSLIEETSERGDL
jgi:hypothetical protein